MKISIDVIRKASAALAAVLWLTAGATAFLRIVTTPQAIVVTGAATTAAVTWAVTAALGSQGAAWRRGMVEGWEMHGKQPEAAVRELRPASTGR